MIVQLDHSEGGIRANIARMNKLLEKHDHKLSLHMSAIKVWHRVLNTGAVSQFSSTFVNFSRESFRAAAGTPLLFLSLDNTTLYSGVHLP